MKVYILRDNAIFLLTWLQKVKTCPLENCEGFIVRITRNDVLNKIYGERIYFVELRRDWSKGMKLIFMKKTSDANYSFIGSGIIDQVTHPDKLSSQEKILCIKNNCYRKVTFARLAKFYPSINVRQTISKTCKSLAVLHGMHLSASDVTTIENLANVSLVS